MLLNFPRFSVLRPSAAPRHSERPRRRRRPAASIRPIFELLEDRTVPSVDMSVNFNGIGFDPRVAADLPDTILAVGPNQVVEATNRDVAFYDKTTGAGSPNSPLPLKVFFAPVLPNSLPVPGDIITDPKVAFDESANRFVVTTLELNFATQQSHLLLAVSNDANPLDGFTEMHRIDTTENGTFSDFPQLGWDADGVYVTVNQFKFAGFPNHNAFDHARVLTFATNSLTDGDNSTLTEFSVDRLPPHFAMQPAAMHGAKSGDPMYFVESMVPGDASGGGGFLDIVQMTNKLSAMPTFTDFKVLVPRYNFPPNADQPGGVQLDTGDARILSAAWRDGRLVATHTAQDNTSQTAQARWYEFSTSGATPTLTQSGSIGAGPGVATFMPSINIAPNGDLGLTFLESSGSQFLSMYLTGQKAGAPAGTLQAPIVAKAGEATLRVFRASGELGAPLRTGDYSGVAIDPADGSFWAANEYTTSTPPPPPGTRGANWGTWIGQFTISASSSILAAAVTSIAQSLPSSGVQAGTGLSFADPLGTIATTSAASAVLASGIQVDNHNAPIASRSDSLEARRVLRAVGVLPAQMPAASIEVLSSYALDSPTLNTSLSWSDSELLDNLNLDWI
jgi:hypothetical protein